MKSQNFMRYGVLATGLLTVVPSAQGVQPDAWRQVVIAREVSTVDGRTYPLHAGDVNKDGIVDITAGNGLLLNPGQAGGAWKRIIPDAGLAAILPANIDGDGHPDLIGWTDAGLYWVESADPEGVHWASRRVGILPAVPERIDRLPARHGEAAMLVLAGGVAYRVELPENPDTSTWLVHRLLPGDSSRVMASGDIDGDGRIDLAGIDSGGDLRWWRQPDRTGTVWEPRSIRKPRGAVDDLVLLDVDGDRRLEVLYTLRAEPGDSLFTLYMTRPRRRRRGIRWRRPHRIAPNIDRLYPAPGASSTWITRARHTYMLWTDENQRRPAITTTPILNVVLPVDLNGDGHTDIVATDEHGALIAWIRENPYLLDRTR